jgi:hypothetical protein
MLAWSTHSFSRRFATNSTSISLPQNSFRMLRFYMNLERHLREASTLVREEKRKEIDKEKHENAKAVSDSLCDI